MPSYLPAVEDFSFELYAILYKFTKIKLSFNHKWSRINLLYYILYL